MTNPWPLLAGILAVGVLYVLVPVVADTFLRFRPKRRVDCPETGGRADVGVDARHAAFTGAFRHPRLRVQDCSLWPERRGCGQACIARLEADEANTLETHAS